MAIYSKKIIEHFKRPRNAGKIKNPDGVGEAGNLLCGDLMRIYLKIGKNKKGEDFIKDIKFETLGCAVAIANSSLLTTLVKGKTIKEALKIKKEDLLKMLGKPLPPFKVHCSVLATEALKEAIYDYYAKKKIKIPKDLKKEHERIVKVKQELKNRYEKLQALERNVLK